MKKVLILEDSVERVRQFKKNIDGNIDITDDTKIAIKKLMETKYDMIFLDHDLGGNIYVPSGDGTGYEVAKWLSEHPDRCPECVIIHSMNAVGVANMKAVLPSAYVISAAWTIEW